MTEHPYENIEAFALGELDAPSAAALLEHADACPTCAVLVADAMHAVEGLTSVDGMIDTIPRRPAPRIGHTRRWQPAAWSAAGIAAAAALILGVWNGQLRSQLPPIGALVHSHFVHHELISAQPGVPHAKVLQAVDGRWLYVVGDGFTPHQTWTLSERAGGASHKVGEVNANSDGRVSAYFEQPPAPITSLSLEPEDAPADGALRWSQRQ